MIHQTNLTANSFTPLSGLPAGEYTAWVRPLFSDSKGAWSLPRTLILTNSATSVLTDPVAGSTNTVPTFGWLPMNVPSYHLRVDNLSSGTTNVISERNLTGTSFTAHESLPPGNYRAWVTGQGTVQSAPVDFQLLVGAVQTQFTVPVGNSENPLPVLGWTTVSGATRYELWVNDVTNGVSRVIHRSALTSTSFAVPSPLAPATYRAWVRAFDGDTQLERWSSWKDFRVTAAAGVPTIWAPVDNTLKTAPLFLWSSVVGATSYELDVSQGSRILNSQRSVVTNHIQLENSLAPGTYLSTVRALNGTAVLGTSQRTFTVSPADGLIELFSPTPVTSQTRPVISWTSMPTATRYVVWINDNTRNVNALILENNVQDTLLRPDLPLLPGDYQVWVRAFNDGLPVSNWSDGVRFTIAESVGPPSVTAPTPNTTNSVPAITWTSVVGAASYDIEIDDVSGGEPAFVSAQGISTTVFRPALPLNPGAYAVRVRSVDSGGINSAWGDRFSLTIDAVESAELVSPLAALSTAASDVLFAWTSVTDAVTYELWVNNVTRRTSRVINETSLTDIFFTPATQLEAGSYRAWVRAIGPGNAAGVWSSGVDFVVTM